MKTMSWHSRRDCDLMNRPELLLGRLSVFLVFCCCCASAEAPRQEDRAPTLVQATDGAAFPTAGPVTVAISLLATVEPDGHISETQVVDSIGSSDSGGHYQGTLTGYIENSIAAVTLWRFSPTKDLSGKRTRSLASITFIYDKVNIGTNLPRMETISPKPGSCYMPPLPMKISRAEYPVHSIGTGTAVLTVRIGVYGSKSDIKIIKSVPLLDDAVSVNAVRGWEFQPAQFQGKPIPSTAIVAFVYHITLKGKGHYGF